MKKTKIMIGVLSICVGLGVAAYAAMGSEAQIKAKYGDECIIADRCDDMLYVDCGAAYDGPAYYLNSALEVIGTGGGLCMGGNCTGEPKKWQDCQQLRQEGKQGL